MDLEILKSNFYTVYQLLIKRDGADKLLKWLDKSDFFTAPASTKYHGAHVGGLCEHSVNVYNRLTEICNTIYPDGGGYALETLAVCGLLHDVCKVDFYKPEWRNKKVYDENGSKRDEGGRFDWQTIQGWTVDDQLPLGHGEKSVYIINGFMKLSRDEAMAIRWHMGGFDEAVKGGSYAQSTAYTMFPLAAMLHTADMLATYIDEKQEG